MTSRIFSVLLAASLFLPTAAFSQSFAVGAHVTSSRWSEFEGGDNGVGGRVTWLPLPVIGVEADFTWYPADFPDGIAFTRNRVEGLFGVTVGPSRMRVRPFAKAGAGFLKVGPTPGAFACIAIFPPPLNCRLAGGETLPTYEIGGGIEIETTSRTFARLDITDRMVKYPGPTFDSNFEVRDEGYLGHAIRFTLGAGFRF
jgi:hypothetical protein